MAVPFLTAFVLLVLFRRRVTWWEVMVPLIVSALLIWISKACTESMQVMCPELHGGWITHAEYYEAWNERVSCRHPKYRTETRTGTRTVGSGKNTRTETYTYTVQVQDGYQHAYDVDEHSPYWQAHESNGTTFTIADSWFERLAQKFDNRQFVELHRHYHTQDGDKYVATWQKDEIAFEPVTTIHYYENRVKASETSIFKPRQIDPKKYGLFEPPDGKLIKSYYECPSILGPRIPKFDAADALLTRLNAKLGRTKQVRVWLLLFVGKPLAAGLEQEAYWTHGNKNEFVVTIGLNADYTVAWCHVFTWMKDYSLKIDTREKVLEQEGKPVDLVALMPWLSENIEKRFVRRQFAEFSYLTVEPPLWMVLLTFFLTLAVNVGLSYWIITNEFDNEQADAGFSFR